MSIVICDGCRTRYEDCATTCPECGLLAVTEHPADPDGPHAGRPDDAPCQRNAWAEIMAIVSLLVAEIDCYGRADGTVAELRRACDLFAALVDAECQGDRAAAEQTATAILKMADGYDGVGA